MDGSVTRLEVFLCPNSREVDPNYEEEDDPDVKAYFPISRIKFILKQDEDFKLPIRKEAYQYIERASVP